MAERITVQLVRTGRGGEVYSGHVIVEAGGNDIDAAVSAFETALAERTKPIRGTVFIRAELDLEQGYAVIAGDPARSVDDARDNFDAARQEYSDGPGWGGSG